MSVEKKLKNLEKKFDLAESLVEELECIVADIETDTPTPAVIEATPVAVIEEPESILSMSSLKQDFALVRTNVIKLVHTGQRILDSTSVLDISDLKASHLEALATLQSTLGSNLKLLMDIYKDIAAIEKSRAKAIPPSEQNAPAAINNGTVNNNNIVFSGSSSELLSLINSQLKG
jgi:hypothetical protein